ncbi:ECF transporter S component [Halothermothrix orenii]|nr:ECF transporter S component [Halothermothrix orenii]
MNIKKVIHGAIFVAIGILLPMIFHYWPGLGKVFLPMHIPVFVSGVFLGPLYGAIVGVLTPLLSSLITGMPPVFPMLPVMVVELGLYGLIMGYFYRRKNSNIYFSLILSMVTGRFGASIVMAVFLKLVDNPLIYIWSILVKGLPGIIAQLVLIPLLVKYLDKKGVTPLDG